jgi:hypothetical protein
MHTLEVKYWTVVKLCAEVHGPIDSAPPLGGTLLMCRVSVTFESSFSFEG